MNKKDIEFLKELQYEMLTQDKVCQASPRFWVVQDLVRTYGIDKDYGIDGQEVIYDDKTIAKNTEELIEYLKENESFEEEDFMYCDGLEEIVEYMHNELDYGSSLYITNYKDEYKIVKDTMFLTIRECKEHIKANHYNYNRPIPYAMTAWRSSQVARLYEILEKTDWDDLSNK